MTASADVCGGSARPQPYGPPPEPGPVREVDLLGFELRHGVVLPGEYRAFLLQIGDESLAPYASLRCPDWNRDEPDLRTPFPHPPEVIERLLRDLLDHAGTGGEFPEVSTAGCLCIGSDNSNQDVLLGVNGPARGQIWMNGDWYAPIPDRNGRIVTFFDWYERDGSGWESTEDTDRTDPEDGD